MRIARSEIHRDPPTHREADDVRFLRLEVVEHPHDVVGVLLNVSGPS